MEYRKQGMGNSHAFVFPLRGALIPDLEQEFQFVSFRLEKETAVRQYTLMDGIVIGIGIQHGPRTAFIDYLHFYTLNGCGNGIRGNLHQFLQ